jgi:hypothetical protein
MDFESNYVALILGFVGVLATFIVIGNYIQITTVESKLYKKEKELEQKFNARIKDAECKISSFSHYKDAMKATRDVDAFYSYILAMASWHDANVVDVNMINSILSRIIPIINQNKVDSIISESEKIDGYALNCCLNTLYHKEINNNEKHKIIAYIDQLKEKGGNKIVYEGIEF